MALGLRLRWWLYSTFGLGSFVLLFADTMAAGFRAGVEEGEQAR